MSDLKCCPFCGQAPEYIYTESTIEHDSHIIRCVDPGCICNVRPEAEVLADSDIDPTEGRSFVTDEWNRRPLEEALEARVKELEAKLAAARQSILDLMADSEGVAGLHLNGDIADWDWLIENEWLGWMQEDMQ